MVLVNVREFMDLMELICSITIPVSLTTTYSSLPRVTCDLIFFLTFNATCNYVCATYLVAPRNPGVFTVASSVPSQFKTRSHLTIQNKDRNSLTEDQEIIKRWKEYCSQLFNHGGTGKPEVLNVPPVSNTENHHILRTKVVEEVTDWGMAHTMDTITYHHSS
ncbi:hypothetical protein PoB_004280000 [Plakobranchus ocellatus]|uniref:Uncharacterized protein n=1 Tax=Plakobranchus ocellatus TaxID=259542 RepID=A0AAV4B9U5_9GAST|nr:hypothetical protein PoB_004280000 [Plakobranchus ocellatus]